MCLHFKFHYRRNIRIHKYVRTVNISCLHNDVHMFADMDAADRLLKSNLKSLWLVSDINLQT